MRPLLILPFLALPAAAQEADAPSAMERGLRLFLDGLMQEMEPALRDLEGLAEEAAPLLEGLQQDLSETLGDLNAYHAPEVLPNGDILIRRKEPLTPDGSVDRNPDGSVDL
ncbi:hypothetical protein JANAI62_06530 [Jannaschia pagri]|uniref:AAA+ family ATPase n=1 Tax=Jannaschia pagri TaxID=2829797 RepID=A0ABQ4NHY4_9RHOB|nr:MULTISPECIES: hypothetical protein [unclassified Jannaschia]GIT89863.1 hypothetical protein JANAI61_03210 [Jannaschia sp. AI_61]GIT94030.1 hypothetical protein JANAI62_06530 [Jannaschia sp. AI_62]